MTAVHALALAVVWLVSLKVSGRGGWRRGFCKLQCMAIAIFSSFCLDSVYKFCYILTYRSVRQSVRLSVTRAVYRSKHLNLSSNGFTICDCDVLAVSHVISDTSFANCFTNRFFLGIEQLYCERTCTGLRNVLLGSCNHRPLRQTLMHCNFGPWVKRSRSLSQFNSSLKTVLARDTFAYILHILIYFTYLLQVTYYTHIMSLSLSYSVLSCLRRAWVYVQNHSISYRSGKNI